MGIFGRVAFCLSIVALLAIPGCGSSEDDLNSVTGTVTLDGEPLEGAFVNFNLVEGGRPASAETDENGYYKLQYTRSGSGATAGEYIVQISTETTDDDENVIPEKLPPRYHEEAEDNDEMKVEVVSGSNVFDFKLTSKGMKKGSSKKKKKKEQRNPDDCS